MQRTDVLVIGAGQSGLALSRILSGRGIDHVVLERRRIAERWLSERWESLRLLTPNWCARLPGRPYAGPDPDGFMTMPETAAFLQSYAESFAAPVVCGAEVRAVHPVPGGYAVASDAGAWHARAVVIATGACDVPRRAPAAAALPADLPQIDAHAYRRPDLLPSGGVLVVGASASGVQIALELAESGRPVTLGVGRHTRAPRRYRGRDIFRLMDAAGVLDDRAEDAPNLAAARDQPSFQLAGRPDGRDVDLPALAAAGVRLLGRLAEADGPRLRFAADLSETTAKSEKRRARLLARLDAFAETSGLAAELGPPDAAPPAILEAPETALDLRAEGIASVIWATGFGRAYPWLKVPVLAPDGELIHHGGLTPAPGLVALGLPFQRRRKSTFIDGAGPDAAEIADHLLAHLSRRPVAA